MTKDIYIYKTGMARIIESSEIEEKFKFSLGGKLYHVTQKRWGILVIVSIILLLDTFSASFFGFINDLSSLYYQAEPATIDLLSTVNMLARSAFGFVLAMAAGKLNLRALTLLTTSTIVAGDILITAGVSSRRNFVITVMGQILNGFGATMALTVTQLAPSNWFPADERGRAVSIPWVTRRISPVISNLVATRAFNIPQLKRGLNSTFKDIIDKEMVEKFEHSFQMAYIVVACVALFAYGFSYVYVTDYPPLEDGQVDAPVVLSSWNPLVELQGILYVFSQGQYVLLLIMYILILSVRPLTEWLMSSIVLSGFPELTDQVAGAMFAVGYSVGALGPLVGGALLDKFKRPKLTFFIGNMLVMLFSGLSSYGFYIHNFPLIFFSYIGTTFSRDFSFICISHAFVEIMGTYKNSVKIRAFSISGSVPWFSLAAYSAVMRYVLDQFGPLWTVMIPIPFYLLALVLYLCCYNPAKSRTLL